MAQAAIKLIKSDANRHDQAAARVAETEQQKTARLAAAFGSLESDIADLSCMATLAGEAITSLIGHDPSPATGDREMYLLLDHEVRVGLFAVAHLERMAAALEDRYRSLEDAAAS